MEMFPDYLTSQKLSVVSSWLPDSSYVPDMVLNTSGRLQAVAVCGRVMLLMHFERRRAERRVNIQSHDIRNMVVSCSVAYTVCLLYAFITPTSTVSWISKVDRKMHEHFRQDIIITRH